jgi:RNA polymerase sigma factor (sigma-70 family)
MTAEKAFDKYHQAIFGFVYRLTRRADLAEDLTQECFLAYLRTPGRFDGTRGTVKTYLFAIARNLVLKNCRDSRVEEVLDEEQGPVVTDRAPTIELSIAVKNAVAELSPLQQEALVLFEYEGCTLEEVAQVVGADVGTVKSRLHRAREQLKRSLAPHRQIGEAHGAI